MSGNIPPNMRNVLSNTKQIMTIHTMVEFLVSSSQYANVYNKKGIVGNLFKLTTSIMKRK